MAKRCDVCNKPFKNAQGVAMHKSRTPACGGKKVAWGQGRKTRRPSHRGNQGESGKEAIRQILEQHPQGLASKKIHAELEERGFSVYAGYITQTASSDPTIVRVRRGIYRLKRQPGRPRNNDASSKAIGTRLVREAGSEAQAGIMPRETLLLRIETLETQNRALLDAHQSLLRGAFAS